METIHVFKLKPSSLWQAAALGLSPKSILQFLRTQMAHPIPYAMQQKIVLEMGKWGRLWLQESASQRMILRGSSQDIARVMKETEVAVLMVEWRPDGLVFPLHAQASVKRQLVRAGFPVLDKIGYLDAPHIDVSLNAETSLRPYQLEAVARFFTSEQNESGVIVLPCGSGKTVVGLGVLCQLQVHTLIVTPNDASARQWREELLTKTTLSEDYVAIYDDPSTIAPITITTYQRVTAKNRQGVYRHLDSLIQKPFGLVIYDEVHMLPAPLFRLAADLQSARRLGLTATLVREDGNEHEVYSLIGSKCYEQPWRELELAGYLANVRCQEVRVSLPDSEKISYQSATLRQKHRIAADNSMKRQIVSSLCEAHGNESVLIMGHFLEQLKQIAIDLDCPFLSGETPTEERMQAIQAFRSGQIKRLVLSRIANMAIDVPSASVAIQVSGLFGSRQEEAQRLGRLLRPGTATGIFYSLVSANTVEERMAKNRQRFLAEQGYAYDIVLESELPSAQSGLVAN